MRKLIGMIVDKGSVFEIQPSFGKAVITCFARMNGRVVGIIANNPMFYGGAVDVGGARKQTHFIRSEEHTYELQSLMRISYAVFCLKKQTTIRHTYNQSLIIKHIY